MKNRLKIIAALFAISLSTISAQPNKTNKKTTKVNKTMNNKSKKTKKKKPEYYRGHSDGLQSWPGKTMTPFTNTGMLSTNHASYMGNDISF